MARLDELYQIADELRACASVGLEFAENGYERERYERVLAASAKLISAVEGRSADGLVSQFQDNLLHWSPLIGVDAAVFRDGRILLIRRKDNGLWAMPGGLTEVGETLAESAERELWEEAGVCGTVVRLLGIFDSRIWKSKTKAQLLHCTFHVELEDGAVPLAGRREGRGPKSETLDVGYFSEDNLPELHYGHRNFIPVVFELMRGQRNVPYFD